MSGSPPTSPLLGSSPVRVTHPPPSPKRARVEAARDDQLAEWQAERAHLLDLVASQAAAFKEAQLRVELLERALSLPAPKGLEVEDTRVKARREVDALKGSIRRLPMVFGSHAEISEFVARVRHLLTVYPLAENYEPRAIVDELQLRLGGAAATWYQGAILLSSSHACTQSVDGFLALLEAQLPSDYAAEEFAKLAYASFTPNTATFSAELMAVMNAARKANVDPERLWSTIGTMAQKSSGKVRQVYALAWSKIPAGANVDTRIDHLRQASRLLWGPEVVATTPTVSQVPGPRAAPPLAQPWPQQHAAFAPTVLPLGEPMDISAMIKELSADPALCAAVLAQVKSKSSVAKPAPTLINTKDPRVAVDPTTHRVVKEHLDFRIQNGLCRRCGYGRQEHNAVKCPGHF